MQSNHSCKFPLFIAGLRASRGKSQSDVENASATIGVVMHNLDMIATRCIELELESADAPTTNPPKTTSAVRFLLSL